MKKAIINAGPFTHGAGVHKGYASVEFIIYSHAYHKRNQQEKAARKLAIYKELITLIELCISIHRTHRFSHHTGRLIRNAAQQRYEYRGTLWFHPLK